MKLQMVKATIGTAVYCFKAPDGLYASAIATQTGIDAASGADLDRPEYTVKELLQKGIVFRLSAITSSGGIKRRLRLLVAKDKLATALDGLKGTTYSLTGGSSGTITSVGFGTRVVSRG